MTDRNWSRPIIIIMISVIEVSWVDRRDGRLQARGPHWLAAAKNRDIVCEPTCRRQIDYGVFYISVACKLKHPWRSKRKAKDTFRALKIYFFFIKSRANFVCGWNIRRRKQVSNQHFLSTRLVTIEFLLQDFLFDPDVFFMAKGQNSEADEDVEEVAIVLQISDNLFRLEFLVKPKLWICYFLCLSRILDPSTCL